MNPWTFPTSRHLAAVSFGAKCLLMVPTLKAEVPRLALSRRRRRQPLLPFVVLLTEHLEIDLRQQFPEDAGDVVILFGRHLDVPVPPVDTSRRLGRCPLHRPRRSLHQVRLVANDN